MANSPSKHFFDGYCRAKDWLTTVANCFAQATTSRPWSIKMQGNNMTGSWRGFETHPYVCLSHEMSTGRVLNAVFFDGLKTASNNVWGQPHIWSCMHDGFTGNIPSCTYYSYTTPNARFFANDVADTEDNPQLVWYWIHINDDFAVGTLFGNSGASGSAAPDYMMFYIGTAQPMSSKFHFSELITMLPRTSVAVFDNYYAWEAKDGATNAPYDWTFEADPFSYLYVTPGLTHFRQEWQTFNPEPDGVFSLRRPYIGVNGYVNEYDRRYRFPGYSLSSEPFLFCPSPSNSPLRRGDILAIQENNYDYIFQVRNANLNEITYYWAIKRMAGAHSLVATPTPGQIQLSWINADKMLGVKVLRKLGSYPINQNDGDALLDSQDQIPSSVGTFIDASVSSGTTYYYAVFAYDSLGHYSIPNSSAKTSVLAQ